MRSRALSILPLLVVVLTFLRYSELRLLGVGLLLATLLVVPLGGRIEVERVPMLVAHLAFPLLGFVAARQIDDEQPIIDSIAAAAVATALFRRYVKDPPFKPSAEIVLVLAAQTALGEASRGRMYLVACAVLLVTMLISVEPGAITHARKRLGALGALAVLATLVSAAVLVAVPALNALTNRRIAAYIAQRVQTGFDGRVRLGDASPIFESEEIVMRVEGARTDYLRGRVFDVLDGSSWYSTHIFDAPPPIAPKEGPETRVQMFRAGRYRFAPMGARVTGPVQRVDGYGVATGEVVHTYGFMPGESSATTTDADLRVPAALEPRLVGLAEEWTQGATTPAQKMTRLQNRLRTDFRYTLARKPIGDSRASSQIVDFLYVSRAGHCEYFASALALLARTVGVPTRVVSGYRVVEWNAFGDYGVVREKHAHAWVEAYVDGRWTTWDATPDTDAMQPRETHSPSAFWDFARKNGRLFWDRWGGSAPWVVMGLVAAFALVRVLLWLRRRGGAGAREKPVELHPIYASLERAIARRGATRPARETLEAFADRVEREHGLRDAAALLRRYAALRYGDVGDAPGLAADVARFVEQS